MDRQVGLCMVEKGSRGFICWELTCGFLWLYFCYSNGLHHTVSMVVPFLVLHSIAVFFIINGGPCYKCEPRCTTTVLIFIHHYTTVRSTRSNPTPCMYSFNIISIHGFLSGLSDVSCFYNCIFFISISRCSCIFVPFGFGQFSLFGCM